MDLKNVILIVTVYFFLSWHYYSKEGLIYAALLYTLSSTFLFFFPTYLHKKKIFPNQFLGSLINS